MGACIPTGTASSVLYATDDNINVKLTQFTNTNCNGATTGSDIIVTTTAQTITGSGGNTNNVQRQICVAQTGTAANTWISSYYITLNAPVLAGTVQTTM